MLSICDCHFAALVPLDPFRYREVVPVICKCYAFDQLIRELLLGGRLALDSSAIGDEELGSAILPVVAGTSHILIESTADTEFA